MSWFADKALFLIRKNNLGFSVPDGCIAVAECHPYEGKDHNLVIVRQQGHLLARRLLRPPHGDELALAAEAPDPRKSKPTLVFKFGDVVLHRSEEQTSELQSLMRISYAVFCWKKK